MSFTVKMQDILNRGISRATSLTDLLRSYDKNDLGRRELYVVISYSFGNKKVKGQARRNLSGKSVEDRMGFAGRRNDRQPPCKQKFARGLSAPSFIGSPATDGFLGSTAAAYRSPVTRDGGSAIGTLWPGHGACGYAAEPRDAVLRGGPTGKYRGKCGIWL